MTNTSPYLQAASERADWTQEERDLARELYVNTYMHIGYGKYTAFSNLSMSDRKPWFEKARAELAGAGFEGRVK